MPLKDTLHDLLTEGSLEQIAEMAERRKRVLGSLVSLTYDPDPLISWRAVEAMGLACDRIADQSPDAVRQLVRRLYWLITEESGGICWRALEAMAEVVSRRPGMLSDFIPIAIFQLREMAEEDLAHFRAGILWATGCLGAVCRDHVPELLPDIAAALDDANPQVRGMAIWCLSQIGQKKYVTDRPDLLSDEGPVAFYEKRSLIQTTVSDIARRVVDA